MDRFTYAINLSALITATAIEAQLFRPVASIKAVVLFCILPATLFGINSLGVAVRSHGVSLICLLTLS